MEASYKIDQAMEYANDFLSSYFFMIPISKEFDDSEEKAIEFRDGKWVEYLRFVQKHLDSKETKYFLVGETITVADIAVVSHVMMITYNDYMTHRMLYLDKMNEDFPEVERWFQT